jgi:hypothetical protein
MFPSIKRHPIPVFFPVACAVLLSGAQARAQQSAGMTTVQRQQANLISLANPEAAEDNLRLLCVYCIQALRPKRSGRTEVTPAVERET